MATLLDPGLLNFLSPVFIFILIFAVTFALLEKVKFISEKSGTNAMIAFSISILFLFIPEARGVISYMTPWFIVLLFMGLLIVIGFLFLGVESKKITEVVTENGAIVSIIFIAVIVLFLVALSKVFGGSIIAYPTGAAEEVGGIGIRKILFNPKVLGIALILVIAAEVIRQFGYAKR